jgi:hypothetical protein
VTATAADDTPAPAEGEPAKPPMVF